MPRQFRIGFSACFLPQKDARRKVFNGRPLLYAEQSMPRYLQSQGALTYMIPPVYEAGDRGFERLAHDLDGLVLVGGVDVSPVHYGEKAKRVAWRGDYQRDLYDMALFSAFRRLDKPIFGICRGFQLINVALGGSLYQDILTMVPGSLVHRDAEEYENNSHRIVIKDQGIFSGIYGAGVEGMVNSIHHQGIKKLGQGARVEAVSTVDGIIEAISVPRTPEERYPSCFAVQWHPEFQTDQESSQYFSPQALLTYFMGAMARRAQLEESQNTRLIKHA
jgi:putative glutamine amidotransferase